MEAKVLISRVTAVEPHPTSTTLDVITIAGKTNVANRPAPDQACYQVGDYAAVLTEGLILPEWLLRYLDLWDEAKHRGTLAGSHGDRTKPRRVAGVTSEVVLCKVDWTSTERESVFGYIVQRLSINICGRDDGQCLVRVTNFDAPEFTPEGTDIGWLLGANADEPKVTQ